jgi:hypothetical protein
VVCTLISILQFYNDSSYSRVSYAQTKVAHSNKPSWENGFISCVRSGCQKRVLQTTSSWNLSQVSIKYQSSAGNLFVASGHFCIPTPNDQICRNAAFVISEKGHVSSVPRLPVFWHFTRLAHGRRSCCFR